MAKQKHSLQINLIDKFAKEFIENEGYECLIEEHPNKTITEKHITISKDKSKGKLVLYISSGQVSYQVQTKNQTIRKTGEECWEYIYKHTKLPEVSAKSFSAKNIDAELFDCFIEDLSNNYQIGLKDRYYKTRLIGKKLPFNTARHCNAPKECKEISDKLFYLHEELLDRGILTPRQKSSYLKQISHHVASYPIIEPVADYAAEECLII